MVVLCQLSAAIAGKTVVLASTAPRGYPPKSSDYLSRPGALLSSRPGYHSRTPTVSSPQAAREVAARTWFHAVHRLK
jgi:hypothetical protein